MKHKLNYLYLHLDLAQSNSSLSNFLLNVLSTPAPCIQKVFQIIIITKVLNGLLLKALDYNRNLPCFS